MVTKMFAISSLLIICIILAMTISAARADSLEISTNDINQIYAFIVVSFGVFVSLIIVHIMNVRATKKTI
jgi:hypothetical protein